MSALDVRALHRDPSADEGRPASPIVRVALVVVVVAGFVPAIDNVLGILGLVIYAPFALVAGVLIFRMPRQPIGWLLLAIGWSYVLATMTVPATLQELTDGPAPPLAMAAAWAAGALGGIPIFLMLFVLAVIFPSGQFPSGRWGRASRAAAVIGALIVIVTMFAPTLTVSLASGEEGIDIANPLAILPGAGFWDAASPLFLYLLGLMAAAAVSLIIRLRRSTGIERQQLRWFVAVLAFTLFGILVGILVGMVWPALADVGLGWIAVIIGLPLIPVAIGIAVLRYRLYEIDVLVNRTVLYGVATLMIAVAFGATNVFLQRLVEAMVGQRSDFVSAAVGAGAAVTVGPLIRTIRPIVDRVLPSRAVLALLFTDIVGSTGKIVAMGDEQWGQLLGRYRSAMRAELSRVRGHEVNTAGDSFFATFGSPSAALDCARAMRDAARALGLETRTGVHYGEVELRGEQVSGLEVHAAARVMAVAEAGQIVVSTALRESLPGSVPVADLGEHELKGVPGSWQLYRLVEGV